MQAYLCQMKSYIQPFEKILAIKEMENFATTITSVNNDGRLFEIKTSFQSEYLLREVGYWERIANQPTLQVLREGSSYLIRNGIALGELSKIFPIKEADNLPNRRVLRYGSHGIHEYRGKFFPQLVRSLINIGKVPENGLVADPMCGSGTTILETALAGRTGLGIDANPLSALLSEVKVGIMHVSPDLLRKEYETIRQYLLNVPSRTCNLEELSYFNRLHSSDKKYLMSWFSHQVLCDLDVIIQAISQIEVEIIRKYFTIILSNILRGVSYQKVDDLRVRKEMKLDEDLNPFKDFLDELGKSVRLILAFLYQNKNTTLGNYQITNGSALEISSIWANYLGAVDAIITSPPYATALPYLDTDRLSLCYLDLLPRDRHGKQNLAMIGNREVNKSYREELWKHYLANKSLLPASATNLIDLIDELNGKANVGFRRKNLSALLSKYFFDMKKVFEGMLAVLKDQAYAFVVIGNNHTKAGDKEKHIDIDTASLLADLAVRVGFQIEESIPMEMLVSRDIFRNNAIDSEYILVLRKP